MLKKMVHNIIFPTIKKFKAEGIVGVLEAIRYESYKKKVTKQRCLISSRIARKTQFTVKYGPFTGLKLMEKEYWGCDQGTKCMGLYEQQVQEKLVDIRNKRERDIFIDVGGADGYFAVGCLINHLYKFVYVFEKSGEGRKNIDSVAELNNVHQNIEIHGEITSRNIQTFLSEHPKLNLSKSVFLVDIDGGEYEVFDNNLLQQLSDADLIIELHDYSTDKRKSELYKESIQSHNIYEIRGGSRDPKALSELSNLMDDDCWLLMSEGRSPMGWIYLESKKKIQIS